MALSERRRAGNVSLDPTANINVCTVWSQPQPIDKLPSSFSHKFEDAAGRQSRLLVLVWEAGTLYWNYLRSTSGDSSKALAKVRQKCFDEITRQEPHFFIGTTQQFHAVAPNLWVMIGPLRIPLEPPQLGLF